MNLQCRSCVVRDWRLTDKAALIRFAERRMIEIIENGKPSTPFMSVGDRIEIEALIGADADASPFGKIEQAVVAGAKGTAA